MHLVLLARDSSKVGQCLLIAVQCQESNLFTSEKTKDTKFIEHLGEIVIMNAFIHMT